MPISALTSTLSPVRRRMCEPRSFKLWLLQFFVLLGLLAFFLWLGLRPKNPRYAIVDFSVQVPNSNATTGVNQGQNGTISFNLEIQNPNKDSSIYYEDILLTLFYNEDSVGQKMIPRFHQGKHKTTHLVDQMDASARVRNTLLINMSIKTAELKVSLATRIQYQTWGVKSKHHQMNMQGFVKIGSDGKISGKKKIKLHRVSGKSRMKLA